MNVKQLLEIYVSVKPKDERCRLPDTVVLENAVEKLSFEELTQILFFGMMIPDGEDCLRILKPALTDDDLERLNRMMIKTQKALDSI